MSKMAGRSMSDSSSLLPSMQDQSRTLVSSRATVTHTAEQQLLLMAGGKCIETQCPCMSQEATMVREEFKANIRPLEWVGGARVNMVKLDRV